MHLAKLKTISISVSAHWRIPGISKETCPVLFKSIMFQRYLDSEDVCCCCSHQEHPQDEVSELLGLTLPSWPEGK